MWIKTQEFINPADDAARRESYRSHLRRVGPKFPRSVRYWIGEERLHDAKLVRFSFDEINGTARFEFHSTGYWIGNPPKPPATRRLALTLSGVEELKFLTQEAAPTSLVNLSYIEGELNSDPTLKPRGKLKSIALYFVGDESLEITAKFAEVRLIEQKIGQKRLA